jgi:hypothetical protein
MPAQRLPERLKVRNALGTRPHNLHGCILTTV